MRSSRQLTIRRRVAAWIVAAISASGLFLAATGSTASAAGNGLYSISPASASGQPQRQYFNYLADPGSTISDSVQVYNQTSSAVPFTLYPADAINAQGGGFDLLTLNKTMHQVGKWTSLADEAFTLPAHSVATVPFFINIPGSVTPGDYAGGIVVRPTNPAIEKKGNFTFAVYNAVGTRIYIRIKGPLHPSLQVTKLAVSPQTSASSLFGGPVDANITYTFKNTGNEILNPTTNLKVSPLIGGATTFIQPFSSILPGQSVTITRHVNSVEAVFKLSADLTITDARPQATTATGSSSALVIPWLAILVIVLLIALYLLLRRRRRHGSASEPPEEGGSPQPPEKVGAAT